jgi:hypothetical protein
LFTRTESGKLVGASRPTSKETADFRTLRGGLFGRDKLHHSIAPCATSKMR